MLISWNRQFAARVKDQVDAVVAFRHLVRGDSESPAIDLLRRRIAFFQEGMHKEYKIQVILSDELIEHLERSVQDIIDAHGIEAVVEANLYEPVTRALLAGKCFSKTLLDLQDGKIEVCDASPATDGDEEE